MKEYSDGFSRTAITLVVIAVVISSGILVVSLMQPNGNTTTTTTTTTTATNNGAGYGSAAVDYIESRRDDVVFYWSSNNTLVNEDLSSYYQATEPSAFVDGVFINQTESGADISVLFSPYHENIVGEGSIDSDTYETMNGALLDEGIGLMEDASTHPSSFPSTWPIELYIYIFFDDNTFFYLGHTSSDGYVFIRNGTWDGFTSGGDPSITGFVGDGHWLIEGGHLQTGISSLYSVITNNVDYPEA
ncbi:MAG: hypothetical protein GF411_16205 [Candidatus Lokiarchaeota archaeon]|nr:hypothetical protein [Candidatus Lokiarchaeota archaeon]